MALWIAKFLRDYHGLDPLREGSRAYGFWGCMMVGCALGLLLLKLFDSRRILAFSAAPASPC